VTARLVLASASPRRRQLLALLGRPFEVRPADVDETPWPGEETLDYVARVAEAKAAVGAALDPGALVVAADTTVELDGVIFGKPVDDADAARMLRALSGREHRVHTHVVVAVHGEAASWGTGATVTATVRFDEIDDARIAAYVATGEPRDKAGAYAVQGRFGAFVRAVEGSVSGVIGLPLDETLALLRRAGYPLPWEAR